MPELLKKRLQQREALLNRVRQLLIEDLKVRREPEEIDPDTPLFGTGLRLDSVDAVELVVAVETAFGLELSRDRKGVDPATLRTLNTLIDFILEQQRDVSAS
jgi:acyl carrier protein